MRFYVGLILSFIVFVSAEYTVVRLGMWQWDRMHEKEAQSVAWEGALAGTPSTFSAELPLFTPVSLKGTWSDEEAWYLANIRSESGMHRGYRVVKPFLLESSHQEVIVDVGWVSVLPESPLPFVTGQQELLGIVQHFPVRQGMIGGPTLGAESGTLLFFDPSVIPVTDGYRREVVYVQLIEDAVDAVSAFHAPFPDSSQHLEYMLTWFIIAFIWPVMYAFAVLNACAKGRRARQQRLSISS